MGRWSASRRWIAVVATVGYFSMGASECPPPEEPVYCDTSLGLARQQTVTVAERGTGLPLVAELFAPDVAAYPQRPYPTVVILPAGLSNTDSVDWAAERLALSGYVAITVKPTNGGSPESYDLAARSAIDFVLSTSNPYRSDVDAGRIGLAGWSLGARSLTLTQELDPRVKAMVAWDNLAVRETGDDGSPTCDHTGTLYRTPRVPAMGQASDDCVPTDPDAKKTAYDWWRANQMPSMEVVYAASTHSWFGSGWTEDKHDIVHWYTRAWFDRWLKNDASATSRLLATEVCGQSTASMLDAEYRSAAYLDGHDCPDLRGGCT